MRVCLIQGKFSANESEQKAYQVVKFAHVSENIVKLLLVFEELPSTITHVYFTHLPQATKEKRVSARPRIPQPHVAHVL